MMEVIREGGFVGSDPSMTSFMSSGTTPVGADTALLSGNVGGHVGVYGRTILPTSEGRSSTSPEPIHPAMTQRRYQQSTMFSGSNCQSPDDRAYSSNNDLERNAPSTTSDLNTLANGDSNNLDRSIARYPEQDQSSMLHSGSNNRTKSVTEYSWMKTNKKATRKERRSAGVECTEVPPSPILHESETSPMAHNLGSMSNNSGSGMQTNLGMYVDRQCNIDSTVKL